MFKTNQIKYGVFLKKKKKKYDVIHETESRKPAQYVETRKALRSKR